MGCCNNRSRRDSDFGRDDRYDRGFVNWGRDDRYDRGSGNRGRNDRYDRGSVNWGKDDRYDRESGGRKGCHHDECRPRPCRGFCPGRGSNFPGYR